MTRIQIAPRPAILATLCAAALLIGTPLRVWAQASTVVAHDAVRSPDAVREGFVSHCSRRGRSKPVPALVAR